MRFLKIIQENDKKISVIPPMFHNNKFISNFKERSELFNEQLFNKYTFSLYATIKSLSSFQFTANNIKSIINKLDPNKTNGHVMVSICMINLCRGSIYKPLEMKFLEMRSCLN